MRKDRSSSLGRGWSGRSTGWAWSGGRGGAGRLTGLILMVLVGGRASVRNADETFGLERELMGRWENLTTRGGTSLTLSPNSVSHRYRRSWPEVPIT
ncbi:hypothetical protein [Metallosphaera yellowstonensis]|uniref:hypothetical protein n=1 Tax=Metallosphaera yellowstonensis TaxID=1111107 RepID=UPI00064EEBCD|nr:hypothetical protein [Metallosphaera yellowstonensis]